MQVRGEVVVDADLADRRAHGRGAQVVRGQQFGDPVELVVLEIKHVDVPRAAKLDRADTELAQNAALLFEVSGDLVGETAQGPHMRFLSSVERRSAVNPSPRLR